MRCVCFVVVGSFFFLAVAPPASGRGPDGWARPHTDHTGWNILNLILSTCKTRKTRRPNSPLRFFVREVGPLSLSPPPRRAPPSPPLPSPVRGGTPTLCRCVLPVNWVCVERPARGGGSHALSCFFAWRVGLLSLFWPPPPRAPPPPPPLSMQRRTLARGHLRGRRAPNCFRGGGAAARVSVPNGGENARAPTRGGAPPPCPAPLAATHRARRAR